MMTKTKKMNLPEGDNSCEKKYIARLYYHGQLEQQFSGVQLNRMLAKLHLMVQSMRTGSVGQLWDATQNKVVHSCTYQAVD